jgi:hypothetical protein
MLPIKLDSSTTATIRLLLFTTTALEFGHVILLLRKLDTQRLTQAKSKENISA